MGLRRNLDFLDEIDKRSSFSEVQVLRTLFLLDENSLGRTKLMRKLGLGEASVKTLLKYLVERNIVEPTTKGHVLTERGEEIINSLKEKISGPFKLNDLDLTVDEKNSAILIKSATSNIENGMDQRDAAIKEGASGATTISYKDGKFWVLGNKVEVPEKIKNRFELEDGDVVVLGSASSYKNAEEGALATILTLLQ